MQFSPYSNPIPLVFLRDRFYPEILMGSHQAGVPDEGRVGNTSYFLTLCVSISKTVGHTSKVTIILTGSCIWAFDLHKSR